MMTIVLLLQEVTRSCDTIVRGAERGAVGRAPQRVQRRLGVRAPRCAPRAPPSLLSCPAAHPLAKVHVASRCFQAMQG